MEVYRSGHNEAVLKTVWVKAHGGSNPSACANETPERLYFVGVGRGLKKARIKRGPCERRPQNGAGNLGRDISAARRFG